MVEKSNAAVLWTGLKFGFMLQAGSIGPICLLLFQLASVLPLTSVLIGVLGVTLADSIYIFCAAVGVAPLVKKIKRSQRLFENISALFLLCLGLFFISLSFNTIDVMPVTEWLDKNIFWGLFVMTLLNPVTVVVFTGIFTAEIVDKDLSKRALFLFALGIVCAGFLFLSFVSVLGGVVSSFLPVSIIKGLNILVGLILICWGIKYIVENK